MVERRPGLVLFAHIVLVAGVVLTALPLWIAFVASTHPVENLTSGRMPLLPGDQLLTNYLSLLTERGPNGMPPTLAMMKNSLVMALGITIGKIIVSFLAAFALVFFRFRFRMVFFWLIFITLMLPVEIRIIPTYAVVANIFSPLQKFWALFGVSVDIKLSLLNSYAGLTLPLIASATATFLFRQVFLTIPDELMEAARIDGARPMQFLRDFLLPLSKTNIAALCVILFIYGWNQYLWPLLITTDDAYSTVVVGIQRMINAGDQTLPIWNEVMAFAILAMLPPVLVVLFMQRLFVKGLIETEK
ncbi:MAG: sn-glycerol-3-phosphate ABC transporter permease UgpE [Arenicellales bacterium]|jgi:sn-glycerol 3-phosphate transport system permease protein|nr:sn-glycerol-3-phosphate ABC transporter permease UgpE [Arenicellales bacterium]|tara:strand:- start:2443 stop:3348 length:906 start_codon:yes stop_codon:yes gene_type:complete